jgi:hypothetical protein
VSLLWNREDIETMQPLVKHDVIPHHLWFVRTPIHDDSEKESASKKRRIMKNTEGKLAKIAERCIRNQ